MNKIDSNEDVRKEVLAYFRDGRSARWIANIGGKWNLPHLSVSEVEKVIREGLRSGPEDHGGLVRNEKRYTFQTTNQVGTSFTIDVDSVGEREAWVVALYRAFNFGCSVPQSIRLVAEASRVGDKWKSTTVWDDSGKPTFHDLEGGAA